MDNFTHTLVGVLLGRAGLKRLTGRATAALVISSNLPDIDSFIAPLIGRQPLAFHRGFTHGIGGLLVLPFFTVAMILLWQRLRQNKTRVTVRFWPLLLVSFIGGLGHSLLDLANSYGIRLLEPLSHRWLYGDAIFIVDPLIWIALIVGLELSWRRERAGKESTRAPVTVLVGICAYIALNAGVSARVEAAARYRLSAVSPTLVVANPQPLEFWRRRVLWRNRAVHGQGWYDPVNGLRIEPGSRPNRLDSPLLAEALRSDPHARAFLFWSRMPIVVNRGGKTWLEDQRFSGARVSLAVPLDQDRPGPAPPSVRPMQGVRR